jgi:uncharacterized membrane protein YebE (DUF533 family)
MQAHDRDEKADQKGMRHPVAQDQDAMQPMQRQSSPSIPMADASGISIRSALFASRNDGVITNDELKEFDRSWMKHKKKNGLDANGRNIETTADLGTSSTTCGCHL